MTALAFILGLLTSSADAQALRSTAPQDLPTIDVAREHLADARLAAVVYRVDHALVLSIAWHESRYTDAATPEAGGRVSCGAMTPEPTSHCSGSLLDGYLAGAKHLRGWLDVTGLWYSRRVPSPSCVDSRGHQPQSEDVMTDTAIVTTPPALSPKPGYTTSEFWLHLAALLLTAFYAAGVIPTSGSVAQVAAIAATLLGAVGYSVARTVLKNGAQS
jgi:hypothetical protein